MPRFLRWITYALGLFLLLVAIAYGIGQLYKPKILEAINTKLKNGIHGDVQIGKLDFTFFEQFPNFSIVLSDMYLRGPQYNVYHADFFKAEKIYIHIKLIHLFRGVVDLRSISVKNGDIFIFRTADGYTNMEAFKKNKSDSVKSKGSALSLVLERINFENTRFLYVDSMKRKSFDIKFIKSIMDIAHTDSSRLISLRGPMWFGGLMFNEQKGGYLSQVSTNAGLNLEFIPSSKLLVIHPSVLKFTKSSVDLSGHFDFTAPGTFSLAIASPEMDFAEGITLVTRSLGEKLSKFKFEKPLKLNVAVLGRLTPGDKPKVDVIFSSQGNQFSSNKIHIDDLFLAGSFTSHIDSTKIFDDYNSRIVLDSISGTLDGIRMNAHMSITNLKDPGLQIDTRMHLNLTDLNQETDTTELKFLSGDFSAAFSYDGRLKEYMDKSVTTYQGKLAGEVRMKDGAVMMPATQKKVDKVNLGIRFNEKQMDFDRISFNINNNPVEINGQVTGFIPFFFLPAEKGKVKLTLYSPRLDLATLIKTKNKSQKKIVSKKDRRQRVSDFMDVLNNKVEFDLEVNVDEIVKGQMKASRLRSRVILEKNRFSAKPVTMKFAGGSVLLALEMSELNQEITPIALNTEVKDVDIRKFFDAFNNFSQKTITSDNLSGTMSAKIQLNAQLDDQFNALAPSMDGVVDFKIRDGALKDFEPLQKMSNFLFKKRDFTDVKFAEINSHFQLKSKTIDISRMEIQSSVLTLFLEGRYSIADSTDLSIQIPFSNLKKRDKDYKPENVGVDAKTGASVYLRARTGKDGKIAISYDPFKKGRKN